MGELIFKLSDLLADWGVGSSQIRATSTLVGVALTLFLAWTIYWVLSRFVDKYVIRIVRYTNVEWDDVVFNPSVLNAVWQLALSLVLYALLPKCFIYYPDSVSGVQGFCKILVVLGWVRVITRTLSSLFELMSSMDRFAENSFKGLCQLFQLLVICGGIIIIISILIGRDPLFVLSGLGAVAAVLMLVFQDTILGFVAGLQLTLNDMLRPGDWITAPHANANGTVLEVSLTTVKIQNFDMTIVTIPPYTLVRDSFQNWRGMQDSGGRRIMRSFNIDLMSVTFATPEQLKDYAKEPWWNDSFADLNGKHPVNLTLLRNYISWYISTIPTLNPEMTWMVRELQPTPEGLPIEIYFFTRQQEWVNYEMVQAETMDHILAIIDHFGLKVYQRAGSNDLRAVAKQ